LEGGVGGVNVASCGWLLGAWTEGQKVTTKRGGSCQHALEVALVKTR